MGRKCSVDGCLSDSNRIEDTGVTFHKVPMHPDIRPKWMSLCHIPEDKKAIKIIYVCSRHFLRADFCNFKGKKYMLKQGVLPSVFPWDKSKLEAIKAEASIKKEEESFDEDNKEAVPSVDGLADDVLVKSETEEPDVKANEVKQEVSELDIKVEPAENEVKGLEELEKEKLIHVIPGSVNFTINSRIEALDFNDVWYPARIVEVDYEENEVLIHFEKFSSKFDEWICMDSPRLRPLQPVVKKSSSVEQYVVGERCMASWSDCKKFPATVTKVIGNDMYEVLFDDGFVKNLKAHRMSKSNVKVQSSPLFDPIKSTKQERRDKKRKLNVAALFGKRPRLESTEEKHKASSVLSQSGESSFAAPPEEEIVQWVPQWENGWPVGVESTIETVEGTNQSVIVPDPRLPPGWAKHLTQKHNVVSGRRWYTVFVSPDGSKLRSKADIRSYLESHSAAKLQESTFDFTLHKPRQRRQAYSEPRKSIPMGENLPQPPVPIMQEPIPVAETTSEEIENSSCLKIPVVDDAFKCPIEGCGKSFRRENLAQMHVKHYHPEYTKFLDSTPNVADLAYARTVGENLDKSPGPARPPAVRQLVKTSTPKSTKLPQSPAVEMETKPQSPAPPKAKDAEIIKLLTTKPFDKKETETIQPLPSGLPSNMYPDIKLRDLLNKAEAIPKRDDINLKTLCATRPPVGIKTLLPVVRPAETASIEEVQSQPKTSLKRKRGPLIECTEVIKGKDIPPLPATPLETQSQPSQPPNNIIIEGGEVIKIVRMKQEEIINCTCGYTEEDGLMIQCELCLCWQHAYCNNFERESQVPEKYVCFICQNPLRERASRRFMHDQDWLKQGVLPTGSYHTKDEELLQKRFEKLKKAHDVSGGLVELREFVHSLGIKLKIAEAKNHPKLYLWSKPWDKLPLPEKIDVKEEDLEDTKPKTDTEDHEYIKNEDICKNESQNESMLMMILKAGKEDKIDLNSLMDNNIGQLSAPIIPQPEAAIESADCRLNLLEHIAHSESLVEERLDYFEKQIDALEEGLTLEESEDFPRTKQTLQMLLRDLGTLREFSQMPTI